LGVAELKLESVGEIIASRRFTLLRKGKEPVEVVVLMGKPEKFPDHTDHYCPYQIKGIGRQKAMAIGGVDAFQAMQLALSAIGVELEVINKDSGGRLVWDADDRGELGFPIPDLNKQ
jgi:uncharacterized protein DUF6968